LSNTDLLQDIVDAYMYRDRDMLLRKIKKAVEKLGRNTKSMAREKIMCKHCNTSSFHYKDGLCCSCYKKMHSTKKFAVCVKCNQDKECHAKNMCRDCYNKLKYHDKKKGGAE
jgi:hypothetical protein